MTESKAVYLVSPEELERIEREAWRESSPTEEDYVKVFDQGLFDESTLEFDDEEKFAEQDDFDDPDSELCLGCPVHDLCHNDAFAKIGVL